MGPSSSSLNPPSLFFLLLPNQFLSLSFSLFPLSLSRDPKQPRRESYGEFSLLHTTFFLILSEFSSITLFQIINIYIYVWSSISSASSSSSYFSADYYRICSNYCRNWNTTSHPHGKAMSIGETNPLLEAAMAACSLLPSFSVSLSLYLWISSSILIVDS